MSHRSRYIAVEGPIGVGKSSLVKLLSEHLSMEPILESLYNNPFLELFYEDPKRYRFQTELAFLIARFNQLKDIAQVDLFKKSIIADYIFERDLIFANINLNDDELQLYMQIYSMLTGLTPKPELVVYLQADSKTLFKRVTKRNRQAEANIKYDYLDQVNQSFVSFFHNQYKGNLLIINSDKIDFVENERDFKVLLDQILKPIRGVEFFNPEPSTFV
ncbi:MAG: deoxynucleoside kinase [Nitrospinota bacterium]